MMSPYAILGLTEDESDERTIKRAYACLLKQHRPDQDPEGFQRVHDAYQRALQMAAAIDRDDRDVVEVDGLTDHLVQVLATTRMSADGFSVETNPPVGTVGGPLAPEPSSSAGPGHDHGVARAPEPVSAVATSSDAGTDPPTLSVQSPQPRPETPLLHAPDSPWDLALAAVQTATSGDSSAQPSVDIARALRRVAELARGNHRRREALFRLLNHHVPAGRSAWAAIFSDDDLLADLRTGGSDLAANTLKGCFEAGDWQRLHTFAERWLERDADELRDEDSIALTRVLAVWLALFDYRLADRLVGHLPIEMRRNADFELDNLLAAGREMAFMPDSSRLYLCQLLVSRTPPRNEKVRWRTGGLMSQIPQESSLRRMMGPRAMAHFAGLATPIGISGGVSLLSVVLWIGSVLFWLAVYVALYESMFYVLDHGLAQALSILSFFAVPVLMYLTVQRLNRRCLPRYVTTWRPWLWRYFGPFDLLLLFLVAYGWLAFGSVWIGIDSVVFAKNAPNTEAAAYWLMLAPPLIVVLAHHVRSLMGLCPHLLPPWQDIPVRIAHVRRLFMLDSATERRELQSDRQILEAILAACPAVGGAVFSIGGLALYPGWSWDDGQVWPVILLVWSGPLAITTVALHAWWSRWREHGRRPWWWPLLLGSGCVCIPSVTWLVGLGPVWLGWRSMPTEGWLTVLALWVTVVGIYCICLAVGRRLRTDVTDDRTS